MNPYLITFLYFQMDFTKRISSFKEHLFWIYLLNSKIVLDINVANINSTCLLKKKKNNMQIYILNKKKKHVLRKELYNWSWIRIATYDNELQASTVVKSRFRVGTWSTITAIHLIFFSRSHYEFIIVRATRSLLPKDQEGGERSAERQNLRPERTRGEKKAHDENGRRETVVVTGSFFCQRDRETWWTQKDRTVPDALLRRQPSRPRRGYEGHRGPASRIPMRFCRST